MSFLRSTLATFILAIVLFFGLQASVETIIVSGSSMIHSFEDGEWVLVNKMVYKFHQPQRGDVIILRAPRSYAETTPFIKRIIGLPGESVEIAKDGTVYVHEQGGAVLPLAEPYITELARAPFKGGKIPPGEYFVLGDNRRTSGDSRYGWTVPHGDIIGKAWISIWPPAKWGLAPNYPLPAPAESKANG